MAKPQATDRLFADVADEAPFTDLWDDIGRIVANLLS